jgi:hypothetical protein
MYWLNLNNLIKDIAENKLTEKLAAHYYLAGIILIMVTYQTGIYFNTSTLSGISLWLNVGFNLIEISLFIFSVLKSFSIHSTYSQNGFLNNLVAISWVLSIRTLILIAFSVIVMIFLYFPLKNQPLMLEVINYVSLTLISLYMTNKIINAFTDIKKLKN